MASFRAVNPIFVEKLIKAGFVCENGRAYAPKNLSYKQAKSLWHTTFRSCARFRMPDFDTYGMQFNYKVDFSPIEPLIGKVDCPQCGNWYLNCTREARGMCPSCEYTNAHK